MGVELFNNSSISRLYHLICEISKQNPSFKGSALNKTLLKNINQESV
jgi:hypothetical protein